MISMAGTIQQFRTSWAVYLVSDYEKQPLMVGLCLMSELLKMPDCKIPADKYILLELLTYQPDRIAGMQQQAMYATKYNVARSMMEMNEASVTCITTNETFENASECAKAHNIDPTALSRHLRGLPGHKAIKKRTYRRGKIDHG